jgi:hypothetical protein
MEGPPAAPYAPPPVGPTPPAQVPPVPYSPRSAPLPPPAHDDSKTILVIVVIAVAAVIIAGVALFAIANLFQPIVFHPYIQLGTPTNSNGNTTILVSSVSSAAAPADFLVRLSVGSSNGTDVPVAASGTPAIETVNGVAFRITWVDVDGSSSITVNDRFLVSGNGVPLPKNQIYAFSLDWSSGGITSWSGETVWST